MENQINERKMQIKLSTSPLSLNFNEYGITSILSWTGMTSCVLMMLVSLALLTIPTDIKPYMQAQGLCYQDYRQLFYAMYGVGAVLMASVLPLLPMFYLLRKRNVEKDVEGVMQILRSICYVQSGLELTVLAFTPVPIALWILAGAVLSIIFTSLKIHGIRSRNPKYIAVFITFQYLLYILGQLGMFIGGITLSATYSQIWIFLLAVLVMMCSTFIWIFDMGFIMTLNTILQEKDRSRSENA